MLDEQDENKIKDIIRGEVRGLLGINASIFEKNLQIMDGRNIQLGRSRGTKIGTATDQKIGFFGVTPVIQQTSATASSVEGALKNLGLADITLSTREVFIPAEAMNPTTTAGCANLTKIEAGTNDVDYWVLDFDTTTEESCFFTLRMPDNWDGLTVTFRFVWTNASGLTTEIVVWGVKGRAYADSDAVDQAYGTEATVTDTWLAQGDIHLTAESTAVTLAGTPAAGQWAQFKISRKTGSDTMTGDCRLLGIRLKYGIV